MVSKPFYHLLFNGALYIFCCLFYSSWYIFFCLPVHLHFYLVLFFLHSCRCTSFIFIGWRDLFAWWATKSRHGGMKKASVPFPMQVLTARWAAPCMVKTQHAFPLRRGYPVIIKTYPAAAADDRGMPRSARGDAGGTIISRRDRGSVLFKAAVFRQIRKIPRRRGDLRCWRPGQTALSIWRNWRELLMQRRRPEVVGKRSTGHYPGETASLHRTLC